jgi:hypothetical protein
VERLKLGVGFKHFAKCKGHSKSCCLPLWLGVFQIFFHYFYEINIYNEDVVRVWIIRGKNRKGSSLTPKLHERAYTLLCLWCTLRLLDRLNYQSEVKTSEKQGVEAHSLARST